MFSIFKLDEEMNGNTIKSVARDQLVSRVSSEVLAAKIEANTTTARLLKSVIDELSAHDPNLKNNLRLILEKEHQEAKRSSNHHPKFYSHTN